jgi:hypothetical protein
MLGHEPLERAARDGIELVGVGARAHQPQAVGFVEGEDGTRKDDGRDKEGAGHETTRSAGHHHRSC